MVQAGFLAKLFNFLKRANQKIIPTIDEIEELSRKCELLNTRIKELENTLKEYNQTHNEELINLIQRQIKDIDLLPTPRGLASLAHSTSFRGGDSLRFLA